MQKPVETSVPTRAALAAFHELDALRAGRVAGLLTGGTGTDKTAVLRAHQDHVRTSGTA